MAAEMNREVNLKDPFLQDLIKKSESEKAPSGLGESIMKRIRAGKKPVVAVFNPPGWIKWGVPALALVCSLLVVMIPGHGRQLMRLPDLSALDTVGSKVNDWLTGLLATIELPELSIPDYAIGLVFGAVVLFWGFIALNRYLQKRFSR